MMRAAIAAVMVGLAGAGCASGGQPSDIDRAREVAGGNVSLVEISPGVYAESRSARMVYGECETVRAYVSGAKVEPGFACYDE